MGISKEFTNIVIDNELYKTVAFYKKEDKIIQVIREYKDGVCISLTTNLNADTV